MRSTKNIFIILLFTFLMGACASKKGTGSVDSAAAGETKVESKEKVDAVNPADSGFVSFVVINQSALDACGLMLKDNQGKEYLPINLDAEHSLVGETIWIKYKRKSVPTTCMRGQTIQILEYFQKL